MKKIIWRLKEQPSSESLRELVKDGILSKDEAREILFSSQEEEDRGKDGLKEEINFLKELVEKLSKREQVVEIIRQVEPSWRKYDWYQPYRVWCEGSSIYSTCNTMNGSAGTAVDGSRKFSDVNTF